MGMLDSGKPKNKENRKTAILIKKEKHLKSKNQLIKKNINIMTFF